MRGCEAIGVDYVPALLERGRIRAEAEHLDVRFVEGDAEDLRFPDASFDAVLSIYGVMFAPDHHRAAAERFAVPPHWAVTTGVALGLPAGPDDHTELPEWLRARARLPRSRMPLESFVHSGKFGHPADFLDD